LARLGFCVRREPLKAMLGAVRLANVGCSVAGWQSALRQAEEEKAQVLLSLELAAQAQNIPPGRLPKKGLLRRHR
jgi:hypothetical protein